MAKWVDIPNAFPYQVTREGRVRREKSPFFAVHKSGKVFLNYTPLKEIKPWDNGRGYKMFGVSVKPRRIKYVHRAVAETFIKNPNNYPEINHKDGNKSNNNVNNLEWSNRSLNMRHAMRTGLFVNRGEAVKNSKLKEYQVRKIKMALELGIKPSELEKMFSVERGTIGDIKRNRNWKHIKLNIL